MPDFFHYTLQTCLKKIQETGIYPNHPYFTTTEYFDASAAGQALGVRDHNIDCVLKFKDDGMFKRVQDVPMTGRFRGGGNQYQHPLRPKPIAARKINERIWKNL